MCLQKLNKNRLSISDWEIQRLEIVPGAKVSNSGRIVGADGKKRGDKWLVLILLATEVFCWLTEWFVRGDFWTLEFEWHFYWELTKKKNGEKALCDYQLLKLRGKKLNKISSWSSKELWDIILTLKKLVISI